MTAPRLAIKVDVDTDRGTREGVPALARLLADRGIKATFLFALGPDNTGRAIRRVFRPGFFRKVSRTSVVSVYGWGDFLNGIFWPGPNIAKRNVDALHIARETGHELGIHCWDHVRWQDGLGRLSQSQIHDEVERARAAFRRVFGFAPRRWGAAGGRENGKGLEPYDRGGFNSAGEARGGEPF